MIMNFLRVGGFQVVLKVFVFSVHLKVYSDPYYFLHLGGNIVSMGMIGRSWDGRGSVGNEEARAEETALAPSLPGAQMLFPSLFPSIAQHSE